ncbi:cupin domain-containing protein [Pedobacter sp. MC2016-05]|uniref:cupin domain-containing protein n=1 Tax=Pedobacter sp. MC2016-05 TaxID=2994474 RepID=UPI002246D4A7|nr:cupin domain-containing protein [Pedobacter sp. MC2016-05]MCX2477264.1 cupin domain-containing protein [Pedobacter sp. MC2016-05]
MERRKFLLASLLAVPFTALAKLNFLTIKDLGVKPGKGFIVSAGESRFFGKKTSSKGTYGRCMISGVDTDNKLYLSAGADLSNNETGGPALHIHHKDDEIFYVVSGEFLIQIDKDISLIKEGDTVFIPRGTAHTFANPIVDNPGELLTIHQPISAELEKFYDVFCHHGYMDEEQMGKLFSKDDLKLLFANNAFVGPPIDVESALKKLKP